MVVVREHQTSWDNMKKKTTFQVVVQLPESFFASHEELLAFEEKLVDSMPKTCEVDGHDIGSGTVNFFILTGSPLAAFNHFRKYLGTNKVRRNLRVAYRDENDDSFINLWQFRDPRPFDYSYPKGIDPFSAKSKRLIPKRSPPGVSKFETLGAEDWNDL